MSMETNDKRNNVCGNCLYWSPYPLIPYIGICENERSYNYDRACISTQPSCNDFVPKSDELETEFLWCEECREYFHRSEAHQHKHHRIHGSIANTDVEFNVESTFAGD